MKSHCRVAVIGGGVVGCSVLYHLTKLGWSDVVLIERKELTAGSTWHAAGGFHALNSDPGVARLQSYTVDLYKEIEDLSGQDVGMHMTGGLNIAATRERWEFLQADHARHRVLGLDTHLVGPAEIKELCPLIDVTGVLGAIFDEKEGHVDPSGATHAYAKAARAAGATIYRHTKVEQILPTGNGTWRLVTDTGDIEAEHVVNAGGLWAREVGHMVGVNLPLVPMEHHYLLTEDMPEVKNLTRDLPLVLDLDGEIYMRRERQGMLLGVYEKEATPWARAGTPWDYGETELLEPALDRLTDALVKGFERFPCLNNVGIRRAINGPFTFTPDGNPLVGPVPGVPNFFAACGVMAGFAQGGGVGLALAQWIIEGEPRDDIFAMDVARFGAYATPNYVAEKASEFYSRRFQIAYPNEYWPASRPARTDTLYDLQKAENGVFGVSYGLEVPLYFASKGDEAAELPCLERSNAFPAVANECRRVADGVGVFNSSSFGKYEFSGRGAEAAVNYLIANDVPKVGRTRLAPLLGHSGRLMGDVMVMRPSEERFILFGSGYLQRWHMRWFEQNIDAGDVSIRNVSDDLQGLTITGPNARELLQRLVSFDVSSRALPYQSVRETNVGIADAMVARVSITGELGYEIYTPASQLRNLYWRMRKAADGLGLVDYGLYALLSMRIEKAIGIWSREYSRDYTPLMAGLDPFVKYDKPDFIGRSAARREKETPPDKRLVLMSIDAVNADASGYEPVWSGEELVGFVTSGAFGHRTNLSLAMGYVDTAAIAGGAPLEVSVLNKRRGAQLLPAAPYDPRNLKSRG